MCCTLGKVKFSVECTCWYVHGHGTLWSQLFQTLSLSDSSHLIKDQNTCNWRLMLWTLWHCACACMCMCMYLYHICWSIHPTSLHLLYMSPHSTRQMPRCSPYRNRRSRAKDYWKGSHMNCEIRPPECTWYHPVMCWSRCRLWGSYSCSLATIHAKERVFADEDTEAMIIVDTSNTFNYLNRKVTLLNCGIICPALSHILINTYRNNSQLFVNGQCILSKEGTTQGDPLAMAMYRIAGNFRGVQVFAFFADRQVTAKIKTTKILTKLRTSRMAT